MKCLDYQQNLQKYFGSFKFQTRADASVQKLGAIITDYGNKRIHNHCHQHTSEVLNSSSVTKMLT